jgi:hypothetical protein
MASIRLRETVSGCFVPTISVPSPHNVASGNAATKALRISLYSVPVVAPFQCSATPSGASALRTSLKYSTEFTLFAPA